MKLKIINENLLIHADVAYVPKSSDIDKIYNSINVIAHCINLIEGDVGASTVAAVMVRVNKIVTSLYQINSIIGLDVRVDRDKLDMSYISSHMSYSGRIDDYMRVLNRAVDYLYTIFPDILKCENITYRPVIINSRKGQCNTKLKRYITMSSRMELSKLELNILSIASKIENCLNNPFHDTVVNVTVSSPAIAMSSFKLDILYAINDKNKLGESILYTKIQGAVISKEIEIISQNLSKLLTDSIFITIFESIVKTIKNKPTSPEIQKLEDIVWNNRYLRCFHNT